MRCRCLTSWMFAILILVVCGARARGQEIRAELSTMNALIDEAITLNVTVSNFPEGLAPTVPAMPDFRVTPAPNNPVNRASRMMIVNGRRTSSVDFTYQYTLQPLRVGRLTVPPFTVHYDGKTYETRPQAVVVRKDTGGPYVLAELRADRPHAYVGESVEAVLEIWVQQYHQRGVGRLDAGSMWSLLDRRQSNLGVFEDADLSRMNYRAASRRTNSGEVAQYYVFEVAETVYPKKPGPFAFGDIQVVFKYPVHISRRFFDLSLERARTLTVEPGLPELEIKALPTEGRPAGFNGAVGRYTISTRAAPTEVPVGDPITVTLVVQGAGRLDLLTPPRLDQVEALTQDFEVAEESLAGEVVGNTKRFMQTIRPRHAEIEAIPPIPFSFFDPKSGRFRTAYSDAIPIEVRPAERLQLNESDLAAGRLRVSEPLVESAQGLLGNKGSANGAVAHLLTDQRGGFGAGGLVLLAAMPMLYLATWLVQRRVTRLRRDEAYRRRSRAFATAKAALREAEAAGSPGGVMSALLTYVADIAHAPAGGMTRADAVRLLGDVGVDEQAIQQVDVLLGELEVAQYAGAADINLEQDIRQARRLLDTVERMRS